METTEHILATLSNSSRSLPDLQRVVAARSGEDATDAIDMLIAAGAIRVGPDGEVGSQRVRVVDAQCFWAQEFEVLRHGDLVRIVESMPDCAKVSLDYVLADYENDQVSGNIEWDDLRSALLKDDSLRAAQVRINEGWGPNDRHIKVSLQTVDASARNRRRRTEASLDGFLLNLAEIERVAEVVNAIASAPGKCSLSDATCYELTWDDFFDRCIDVAAQTRSAQIAVRLATTDREEWFDALLDARAAEFMSASPFVTVSARTLEGIDWEASRHRPKGGCTVECALDTPRHPAALTSFARYLRAVFDDLKSVTPQPIPDSLGGAVGPTWDVFISHASEDKDSVVRALAHELRARGLNVWYDEFELGIGDSLRAGIDRGLAHSRRGIVVLSPAFFAKHWTAEELNGLTAIEASTGEYRILPVWHEVDAAAVAAAAPMIAGRLAGSTSKPIRELADDLVRALHRPLVH
jgi:hypothetical protein